VFWFLKNHLLGVLQKGKLPNPRANTQYYAVLYSVLAHNFLFTFYRIGRHAFSFAAVELTINNRRRRRLLTKRLKMYIYVYTCNCNSFNVLLLLLQ